MDLSNKHLQQNFINFIYSQTIQIISNGFFIYTPRLYNKMLSIFYNETILERPPFL